MSKRYDHVEEYGQRFNQGFPAMYMAHLSDEDFDARLVRALEEGKPIEAEEYEKQYPEGADIL